MYLDIAMSWQRFGTFHNYWKLKKNSNSGCKPSNHVLFCSFIEKSKCKHHLIRIALGIWNSSYVELYMHDQKKELKISHCVIRRCTMEVPYCRNFSVIYIKLTLRQIWRTSFTIVRIAWPSSKAFAGVASDLVCATCPSTAGLTSALIQISAL